MITIKELDSFYKDTLDTEYIKNNAGIYQTKYDDGYIVNLLGVESSCFYLRTIEGDIVESVDWLTWEGYTFFRSTKNIVISNTN